MNKQSLIFSSLIVLCTCVPSVAADHPLAHMVFFTLGENSEENRLALMKGCKKHLNGHEGVVHFSVGAIASDLDREVNDRDFHVALHLVFANRAAHDVYQTHPRHLRFIEENKHLWSKVRVFDSNLFTTADDARPEAGKHE